MRFPFYHFLMCIFLFIITMGAKALPLDDLYTASVPIMERSTAAIKAALPKAFAQVLIKQSGNEEIMSLPQIQSSLKDINNQIISYKSLETTNEKGEPQLMLNVKFDGPAIKRLLLSTNQGIWSPNRPLTLFWLVSNQTEGASAVVEEEDPLATVIKEAANERGIPFILPTLNLEQPLLTTATFSTLASQYAVKSIVIGHMSVPSPGHFQIAWDWRLDNTPTQWNTEGNDINKVVNEGVQQLANLMSNQQSTLNSRHLEQTLRLQISGINSLADYAELLRLLRQMPVISKITPSELKGDSVILSVITTNVEQLTNILHQETQLLSLSTKPNAYQWQAKALN